MTDNLIDKLSEELNSRRNKIRFERQSENFEKSKQAFDAIESSYFSLLKDLTILSATVFASSIALSSGRKVTQLFFMGELFLLASTLFGILLLWSQLRGREWIHHLMSKSQIEFELSFYKDLISDFEKKNAQDQIQSYEKLLKRKGISHLILRVINIEIVPKLFFISLTLGLVLILLSLIYN